MRDRDLADSPLASHFPDIASDLDSLPDVLREKIAELTAPLPRTPRERVDQFFAVLAAALRESNLEEASRRGRSAGDDPDLMEGLRAIAGDARYPGAALRAACLLKQLGLDSRSDQQLAEAYGLTSRAAPQNIRRGIEKRTGLRSRSSKSDATRENCRKRRIGQRRAPAPFTGAGAWARVHTLVLTLPVP